MARNPLDATKLLGNSPAETLLRICFAIPWERVLIKDPRSRMPELYIKPVVPEVPAPAPAASLVPAPAPAPTPATSPAPTSPVNRPGCTAADEAAVALFHLDGLARGKGGYGVLRVSKERLEVAASAAESLKHADIAAQMRAIAAEMPNVSSPEEAQVLKDRLEPVVYDQAWDLGRRCKGALTAQDLSEIRALADRISARK
jgi:hypothetical protein